MWRYLLMIGGTGSVEGGSGWYLVLLGQFGVVLVDIMVLGRKKAVLGGTESIEGRSRYWLILDGTG